MEKVYRGLLKIAIELLLENEDIAKITEDWFWQERMQEQVGIMMGLLKLIDSRAKIIKEGGDNYGK